MKETEEKKNRRGEQILDKVRTVAPPSPPPT